jgi:hypothetical protein
MHTHKMHQQAANHCLKYIQDVHKYHAPRLHCFQPQRLNFNPVVSRDYLSLGNIGSTSTLRCAASTHLPAVGALHQLRRAPRLLISRSHGVYINYAVHSDYSSPGRTGSTSTTSCAATTRLPVARALPQPYHVSSYHSASRRSVALALAVRPVTASRGATTRRPDCTSSTAPMLCIRTRRLTLNFSSVGRTGSRRVPSHCISRRDYSSFGLHQLYCAYAVHPDAPSRRSTSRWSITLALTVRPVTVSHGATTRRPDCTGSTAPMLCIWTRRLDARLLVSQSHWLSPCARSFCCAS